MPNLNYESIYLHFLNSEFDIEPTSHTGFNALSLRFEISNRIVTLIHFHVLELQNLPSFYLVDCSSYGNLAHVLQSQEYENLGAICINDLDSVSVNFERPELAFEESINRHIQLLSTVIEDPNFNQQELLREFNANWLNSVSKISSSSEKALYCSSNSHEFEELEIYKPIRSERFSSIPASYISLSTAGSGSEIGEYFGKAKRILHKEALCFVIPLKKVDLELPKTESALKEWLYNSLEGVDSCTKLALNKQLMSRKSKEFWLALNLTTPSGITWFGVRLTRKHKKTFPNTIDKYLDWKICPINIEVFNKDRLMPRSGANSSLTNKSVLLVGCGSVGCEVADKLGAAGVGNISITDPDVLTVSNTYRHSLNQDFIHFPKAQTVSWQLTQKYPWINATGYNSRLLDLRDKKILSQVDIIIIAIGAPTQERLFNEYLTKYNIKTPVIYTWLEGYGIGGHAILSIPGKKGCLRCAYVDISTGNRGLASNLNFLQPNQNIIKNHAGCGDMFIPYGSISSAQTALIAANLAIDNLNDKQNTSAKISWKGDRIDADKESLALTRRYNTFNSSLKKQPLHNQACDVCAPTSASKFEYDSLTLFIPTNILKQLSSYKQKSGKDQESAGLLIGYVRNNNEYWIDQITTPKETDIRKRNYFKLDPEPHQKIVNDAYDNTDGILGYQGTWHSHPQSIPTPSKLDLLDWKKHCLENGDRHLFFIVVGLDKTSVYAILNGKKVELKSCYLLEEL